MSCILDTFRSSLVKSYLIFHPIGPNLRRSCTIAWKKQSEKKNDLNNSGLEHASNSSSFKLSYCLCKFNFNPFGGSIVILIEFFKTFILNLFEDIEVSHNLKLTSRVGLFCNFSISSSNLGMKLIAKWQFCNNIHPPFNFVSSILDIATLSIDLPKETNSTFLPIESANCWKSFLGSDPVDKTNNKGILLVESSKDFNKLNDGGSVYSFPKFFPT